MSDGLSAEDIALLRGENYGYLVTLNADGTPQVTVTWVDASDDGHVLINSAAGRRKDRNMRRDPRVAVSLEAAMRCSFPTSPTARSKS